jgi:DNA-binding LacI/PurR family transcriptional regulator
VSGPLNLPTSQLRRDIFLDALTARGIRPAHIHVQEGNLRINGGREALNQLLALPDRPTAIFAANDLTAIGIMWAARERGLRVPEDVSIVGLDDIQLARDIHPPLTTVAMPRHEIGRMSMQMLLDLLQVSQPHPQPVRQGRVDTHLVIRQSTARPQSG